MNFDSYHQRYVFRQTHDKCILWGRVSRKIVASYIMQKGETHESLLLVDGWLHLSRHFHYFPEFLAKLHGVCRHSTRDWCGSYLYAIYLMILLTDQAYHDDDCCYKKYGKHWD